MTQLELAMRQLVGYERSLRMVLEERSRLDARVAEWQMRVHGQMRRVADLRKKEAPKVLP